MKLHPSLLALVLLLTVGCKRDAGRGAAEKAPQTPEEYTRAIVKEVQKVILSTDQQLREYPPQKVELPAEEGQPARTLQLWTEEGNPVKLTVDKPSDAGFTAFYFANGELFYAADADGGYIFIGPELKYWLDENWTPVEAPGAERRKKGEELLEEARRYLGIFG